MKILLPLPFAPAYVTADPVFVDRAPALPFAQVYDGE